MNKIVIIDNDPSAIETISSMAEAMNYSPVIQLEFDLSQQYLLQNNVVAIFINIDLSDVQPENVIAKKKTFNKDNKIALIYIYSSRGSDNYKKLNSMPHTAELNKPFSLEELYSVFRDSVMQCDFLEDEFDIQSRIKPYHGFISELKEWLGNINSQLHE